MAKKLKKGGDPKFTKLDQRIYANVLPFGYSTDKGNRSAAIHSILKNKRDRDLSDPYREELWKYALGGSEPLKNFQRSQYSPSKATEEGAEYLSPNYLDRSAVGLNELMTRLGDKNKIVTEELPMDKLAPEGAGNVLGKYTLSKGQDEKGTYISIYDKWDLGNKRANKFLDRKPEIYDRIYYQENPIYAAQQDFRNKLETTKGTPDYKKVLAEQKAHYKEHGSAYTQGRYLPISNNNRMASNNVNPEEYGFGGILAQAGAGAASGALAGSVVPGWGTAVGAVGGFLGGLWKGIRGNKQDKQQEAALQQQNDLLAQQQQQQQDMLAQQPIVEEDPTFNPEGMINVQNQYQPTFPYGGLIPYEDTVVELENDEVFRKPGEARLHEVDGKTHAQGGEPYKLPVGTEVLGKNVNPVTGNTFKQDGMKLKKLQDRIETRVSRPGTIAATTDKKKLEQVYKGYDELFTAQEQMKEGGKTGQKMVEGGTVQQMFGGGLAGITSMLPSLMQGLQNRPAQGFANVARSLLGGGDPTQISYGGAGVGMGVPAQGGFGKKLWGGLQNLVGNQGGVSGLLNKGMQLSPIMYNFAQGMQPAQHLTASDYYNPEYGRSMGKFDKAIDTMANLEFDVNPLLDENRNAQMIADYNARNQGGLSAGAVASNRLGSMAQRMRADQSARATQQNMNNMYQGQLAGMLGQAGQFGAQLGQAQATTDFNVDNINMQSDAAQRAYLGQGFSDLSEYGQRQQLMKNQQQRDKDLLGIYPDMFKSVYPYMQGMQNLINRG